MYKINLLREVDPDMEGPDTGQGEDNTDKTLSGFIWIICGMSVPLRLNFNQILYGKDHLFI